ncbi:MAG: hypothetical protein COB00_09545 [Alcanivorax sp.]|nr:MAG: hypothetical protein COB00_09545 [Alcanivorax sp.]
MAFWGHRGLERTSLILHQGQRSRLVDINSGAAVGAGLQANLATGKPIRLQASSHSGFVALSVLEVHVFGARKGFREITGRR